MNTNNSNRLRLLLNGHGGFHNRGCEAIVRSTMSLLDKEWPDVKYLLYSSNATRDKKELLDHRVVIRDAKTDRFTLRWLFWGIWKRNPECLKPLVKRFGSGYFDADLVLSVGGDNYSLDYGSPKWLVDANRICMSAGIPVVIWGASIGPFEKNVEVKRMIVEHLQSVDLITARETTTVRYLKSIGVSKNVVKVFDPAFSLESERYEGPEKSFVETGNVIGLNISPLIVQWRKDKSLEGLIGEVEGFIENALSRGFKVIMIPHVSIGNKIGYKQGDDYILNMLETCVKTKINTPDHVMLSKSNIPARQVKWIISRCKYFIGARTHSTIAALSSGVPTITIAYSMKARGINMDIFEHNDYILDANSLSKYSLIDKLECLIRHDGDIRAILRDKKIDMAKGAEQNVVALREVVHAKLKNNIKTI